MKPSYPSIFRAVPLVLLVSAGVSTHVSAQAQTPTQPQTQTQTVERSVTIQRTGGVLMTGGADALGANIEFMAAPIAFDIEPVTGAPYSADAITEVTQTLADGNRIVRQSKAEISRDGLGRTRREQGLAMLGPIVNGPEEFRQIQITDPQAGTITLLDPQRHTAHSLPAPSVEFHPGQRVIRSIVKRGADADPTTSTFELPLPAPPDGKGNVIMFRSTAGGPQPAPVVEQLGQQLFDGVGADGTRTTVTIPAGQIGNEQPIKIVDERWYSSELKALLESRHSDPRFGETIYRLTNILRGEPAPWLFEIPSDYSVER